MVGPDPTLKVKTGLRQRSWVNPNAGPIQQLIGGCTINVTPQQIVGISFSAAGTEPANNAGVYSWVQLITNLNSEMLKFNYRGACPGVKITPDSPKLDTEYPYGGTTPGVVFQIKVKNDVAADSPGAGLGPGFGEIAEIFNASMYLMWTPNADSNCTDGGSCVVPVPLGSVAWSFQGDSINTLVQNASNTTWILNYGYPSAAAGEQATFAPATGYPQWIGTAATGQTCQ
jgi:hypothetical protein